MEKSTNQAYFYQPKYVQFEYGFSFFNHLKNAVVKIIAEVRGDLLCKSTVEFAD